MFFKKGGKSTVMVLDPSKQDNNEDNSNVKESNGANELIGKIITYTLLFIIGVVFFLPSVVITWLTYQLIRNRKFKTLERQGANIKTLERLRAITRTRPHIATLIVTLINLATIGIWHVTDSWGRLFETVTNYTEFNTNWQNIILPMILINIIVGTTCGLLLIYSAAHAMKSNPWLIEAENSWEYKFEYARTPLEHLRMKQRVQSLKDGDYSNPERAPIGITLDYDKRDDIAYRYTLESVAHTLIFGSTGSGKTITLLQLNTNDVRAGKAIVTIDFKASPEFTAYYAELAKEYKRPFYHFMGGAPEDYFLDTSEGGGQSYYIPLNGSPGTQADMMINIREWDTASQVYKGAMQDLLQVLFHAIDVADRTQKNNIIWDEGIFVTLESILNDEANLTDLAIACEGTPSEEKMAGLVKDANSRNSFQRRALDELKSNVRTIMSSEYGRWLRYPKQSDERYIDLFELLSDEKNPPIILFSFASDMQKEFSSFMGSLIFADITNVSARRRDLSIRNIVSVNADEFQGVPVTAVEDLLEKARGSNMAVTLSAQSVNQIAQKDPQQDSRIKKIFDTCDNFYVHQGSTQETAERLSGIMGKTRKKVYSVTNKSKRWFFEFNFWSRRNLLVTNREEEVYRIPTESFMKLEKPNKRGRSTMIMINKSVVDKRYASHQGTMARHVLVVPETAVLESEARAKKNAEHMMQRLAEKQRKNKEKLAQTTTPIVTSEPSVETNSEPKTTPYSPYVEDNATSFYEGDDAFSDIPQETFDINIEDDGNDWGWEEDTTESFPNFELPTPPLSQSTPSTRREATKKPLSKNVHQRTNFGLDMFSQDNDYKPKSR